MTKKPIKLNENLPIAWEKIDEAHDAFQIDSLQKWVLHYGGRLDKPVEYFVYREWLRQESLKLHLPDWIKRTISYMAYEQGHSAGESEVKLIREGMEAEFLNAYKEAMNNGEIDC